MQQLLNDMALFVEVAKAKGFRGAAEALGMPNSTLSRRVALLEKAIGLRLLHRTTRTWPRYPGCETKKSPCWFIRE